MLVSKISLQPKTQKNCFRSHGDSQFMHNIKYESEVVARKDDLKVKRKFISQNIYDSWNIRI